MWSALLNTRVAPRAGVVTDCATGFVMLTCVARGPILTEISSARGGGDVWPASTGAGGTAPSKPAIQTATPLRYLFILGTPFEITLDAVRRNRVKDIMVRS